MVLFVIVGVGSPGKTTILAAAKELVQKSPFYLFSSIYTTAQHHEAKGPAHSPVDTSEGTSSAPTYQDETFVTDEEYKQLTEQGAFGHTWKDRLFHCGLLKEVNDALLAEKKVVISAPPAAIPELAAAYGQEQMTIIRVTAPAEVLAARKTSNKAEVKLVVKKIFKLQNDLKARSENMLAIDNSGTPEESTQQLLNMMGFDAALEIPPPDANDLQNCLPQDYLKRTVFPYLNTGLALLDTVRPADPVDFLATYLQKSASTTKRKVMEMREEQRLRSELRRDIQLQYNVEGRI